MLTDLEKLQRKCERVKAEQVKAAKAEQRWYDRMIQAGRQCGKYRALAARLQRRVDRATEAVASYVRREKRARRPAPPRPNGHPPVPAAE